MKKFIYKIFFIYFLFIFISNLQANQIYNDFQLAKNLTMKYFSGCQTCIDDAINTYTAIANNPSATLDDINNAKIEIGWCYCYKKDYNNAELIFADLLSDTNNGLSIYRKEVVLYQLGYVKYLNGKIMEAIDIFKRIKNDFAYTGKDSKVPFGIYMWGKCLEAEGNTKGARSKYEEVITNYPEHLAAQIAQREME